MLIARHPQANRIDVLLAAEVVCATLSGSGSQTLIEAVMLNAQAQVSGKAKQKLRSGQTGVRTPDVGKRVLRFDAVVMVRWCCVFEP